MGTAETKLSAIGVLFFFFYSNTLTISPISFLLSCKMKGGGYEHEVEGGDEGEEYKGEGDEGEGGGDWGQPRQR